MFLHIWLQLFDHSARHFLIRIHLENTDLLSKWIKINILHKQEDLELVEMLAQSRLFLLYFETYHILIILDELHQQQFITEGFWDVLHVILAAVLIDHQNIQFLFENCNPHFIHIHFHILSVVIITELLIVHRIVVESKWSHCHFEFLEPSVHIFLLFLIQLISIATENITSQNFPWIDLLINEYLKLSISLQIFGSQSCQLILFAIWTVQSRLPFIKSMERSESLALVKEYLDAFILVAVDHTIRSVLIVEVDLVYL